MVRIRVRTSKIIDKPVSQVYQYLADFSKHKEWDDDAKRYATTPGLVELGSTFQRVELCDTVTNTSLGTADLNSTRTILRKVTSVEINKHLEFEVTGENGLMHRVEFFDLEPINLDSTGGVGGEGIGEGEATRVTKGTVLVYPSLRKNYLWLVFLVPLAWPFVFLNAIWMPSIMLNLSWDHRGKLGRIKKNLEGLGRSATTKVGE